MENSRFEKMEIERFNSYLLRTISFAFWFLGMILIQLPLNNLVMAIVGIVATLFGIMFFYASVKVFHVYKKIKKDPALYQALMNEMYLSFDYKAVVTGYYSMLAFVVILVFLGSVITIPIPIKTISMAVIYVGVVSTDLRRLFLYKQ